MERFYYISQPTLISFTSGQRIEYTYDADGNRLRAVYKTTPEPVFDPVTGELIEGTGELVTELRRDYCHGRVYEDGERVYETFGEGFIDDVNTVYYYVHDYLGNVRAVVREDGAVVEENDYYPYGLLFPDKPNATGISARIQPYTTTGKELDTHYSLNWLNFGTRQYMPDLGQWNRVDDLCEEYYPTGPYVYCHSDPVNRIDPNGLADFIVNGKIIGNDGIDDGRILAIKTRLSDFNGVRGAGLSQKEYYSTIHFIKKNSGDINAFKNNNIAYINSICIENSVENRQKMLDAVFNDNGRGGNADANNREYGGYLEDGKVNIVPPGEISNPKTRSQANIELPSRGVSTFHSHPSGQIIEYFPSNMSGKSYKTYYYVQSPSETDIKTAGSFTHYVFGRGNGNVYVYNSEGIQAIIPQKRFVFFK